MSRPKTFRTGAAGFLARVLLSVGLLSLAVLTNREPIGDVLARRPDVPLLAVAFGLYFSGVLLAYLRWYLLVRALALPLGLLESVRLGLIGTLFNLVIPGAVGGDFVKAAYFLRTIPGKKTQGGASVAIDRVMGLLGLFILSVAVGVAGWGRLDPPRRRLVIVAAGLALAVSMLLAVGFTPWLFRGLVVRLESRPRLAAALHELAIMGSAYRNRLGTVGLTLALALATHVLNVLAFYLVSRALFPSVPGLAEHFLIVPLVLFSTAIPLPFGALGVSEQVSYGLFRLVSYNGGGVAMMGFRLLQYTGCQFALAAYLTRPRDIVDPEQALNAAGDRKLVRHA